MTSFADDTRFILNARKAKYNMSVASAEVSETQTVQKAYVRKPAVQEKSEFSKFVDRRRRYVKRKQEAFAGENRKVIREAFERGTNKADISYDDYEVKEHNFPIAIVAIAFALTIVAVFLLLNFSQISKFNDEINKLEGEMAEDAKRISELDMLIDKNTNISEVEEYAKSRGMIKQDRVETKYINMSSGYKIEKMPATQDDGYTISTAMSGVLSLLGESW